MARDTRHKEDIFPPSVPFLTLRRWAAQIIAFDEANFYLGDGAFQHLHRYSLWSGALEKTKRRRRDADYGYAIRGNMSTSRYDEKVARIYMYLYMYFIYTMCFAAALFNNGTMKCHNSICSDEVEGSIPSHDNNRALQIGNKQAFQNSKPRIEKPEKRI